MFYESESERIQRERVTAIAVKEWLREQAPIGTQTCLVDIVWD